MQQLRKLTQGLVLGQRGILLPMTLVLSSFGFVVATSVAVVASGDLTATRRVFEQEQAYYAASGAIEAVLADAVRGLDLLAPGYVPPQVTLNDLTPSISVSSPSGITPAPGYRYLDAGAATGLNRLDPERSWDVEISGVEPFSVMVVNVAFTAVGEDADDPEIEIHILDGQGEEVAESHEDDVLLLDRSTGVWLARLSARLGVADTYIVRITNDGDATVFSEAYSSQGGQQNSWVLAKSTGKEYLLRSRLADGFEVQAYVRQIPGPGLNGTQVRQMVVVESWTLARTESQ